MKKDKRIKKSQNCEEQKTKNLIWPTVSELAVKKVITMYLATVNQSYANYISKYFSFAFDILDLMINHKITIQMASDTRMQN